MREKYESLALVDLKALAKVRGLKGTSAMKKAELVEVMLAEDMRVGGTGPEEEEGKESTMTAGTGRKAQSAPEGDQKTSDAPAGAANERPARQDGRMRSSAPSRQENRSRGDGQIRQEVRGRSENTARQGTVGRGENHSRNEGSARQESVGRGEGYSRNEGSVRQENSGRGEGFNRNEGSARQESAGRGESFNRNEGSARQESVGRGEGYNRHEGPARQENGGRGEGYSRNEGPARQENGGRGEGYSRNEGPARQENSGRGEGFSRNEGPARQENSVRGDGYNRNEGTNRQDGPVRMERSARAPEVYDENQFPRELDSGEEAMGILEVMPDGYGFIRCENYLPGENDVYVAPSQIRRFGLKTGDILRGNKRVKTQQEKFSALLFIRTINGYTVEESAKRTAFEDMTPIFPNRRIKLETPGCSIAMRVMDLVSPVGKGQRGMIVSPPKAGKTTLLKDVAKSVLRANSQMHMLILLIDERPEEVTDIKEAIQGRNVEVIYSTFDELPEHHKRVSEMVIERAKRLVEHGNDVVILLDSITRLTRAYNQVVPPSGRTLSGGLDPSALHMPKRFFGAARNMREGGSLTILATALVDTGSKMDDVVYEEFKGTGNMEIVLDRKLSEKRIFPAIDLQKSGTRREDLLLSQEELEAINIMRRALNSMKADEAADRILDMFARTRNNNEFVQMVKKNKFI